MGFGASLVLMAAGAILWFAVDVATEGIDLNMVGVILFVIGASWADQYGRSLFQ